MPTNGTRNVRLIAALSDVSEAELGLLDRELNRHVALQGIRAVVITNEAARRERPVMLLPVVTPGLFESTVYGTDLDVMLGHERRLKRDDLVLPIIYKTYLPLYSPAERQANPLLAALFAHPSIDLRPPRRPPFAPELEQAARRIGAVLQSISDDQVNPPSLSNAVHETPGPPDVAQGNAASASHLSDTRHMFVCYRRDDSEGYAGRLHDRLKARFGDGQVFMDIDNIEPGQDFVEAIQNAVTSCAVVVAIIGRNWLTSTDGTGRRRLDLANDFVRLELSMALANQIPVIPVLVHGARMPEETVLPDEIKALARRQALELSHTRWNEDVERLARAIQQIRDRHKPTRL